MSTAPDSRIPDAPLITDGVVVLDTFRLTDVGVHIAGEDADTRRFLNDGEASTVASTTAWAQGHLDAWAAGGGPRRLFAIRDAGGRYAGAVEANLDAVSCGLPARHVNISYQVARPMRGRGYAARAVTLLCGYLRSVDGADVAVLRIEADNAASLHVAVVAGFSEVPWTGDISGQVMRRFDLPLGDTDAAAVGT